MFTKLLFQVPGESLGNISPGHRCTPTSPPTSMVRRFLILEKIWYNLGSGSCLAAAFGWRLSGRFHRCLGTSLRQFRLFVVADFFASFLRPRTVRVFYHRPPKLFGSISSNKFFGVPLSPSINPHPLFLPLNTGV